MKNTALIIVDLQNDYFPTFQTAKWKLDKTEDATFNALKILKQCREQNIKVIHVHHEFEAPDAPFFQPNTEGAKIHESLKPLNDEIQVLKHNVNSFKDTKLKEILDDSNIKNVIIVGAMSHICIDSITRAASDFGYNCFVAHDACATHDLEFKGVKVDAASVHAAYMYALEFAFAKVQTTDEIIDLIKE
ncbi:cysteine hydrolase [Poseidonibacter lekithochrous]|uniref:cysteine hydrolase family protein n=1 Tax=Poseidonibacter TaxID=2321187 RepID=UPI001C086DA7|nr:MULTISPECIES: cysteine hydrolase family protein [Poseidonibacter]MBU3015154.1 cysteine hydrolase [Poseidonibacter lekithochrous]MDO6828451.1 cysteine hydrolase family protein [Poseidonibacter sp. 1_MG-2023]